MKSGWRDIYLMNSLILDISNWHSENEWIKEWMKDYKFLKYGIKHTNDVMSSIFVGTYRFQYILWQPNFNTWSWLTGPHITWIQTLLPRICFLALIPSHTNHLPITQCQYIFFLVLGILQMLLPIIQPRLAKSIFTFHSTVEAPFCLTLSTSFHKGLLWPPN